MAVDISQGGAQGAIGQTTVYTASAVATVCPITMVGWINPEGLTGTGWGGAAPVIMTIIDNRYPVDLVGDHFVLQMSVSGSTWSCQAQAQDFLFSTSANSPYISFDEAWHHVAAVFEGTTNDPTFLTAYVDGTPGAIEPGGGDSPDNLNWTSCFGEGPQITSNKCYREGCGADFAMYNAALTAAEIAQLASGDYRPGDIRPANLLFWLKMDTAGTVTVNEVGAAFTSSIAPTYAFIPGHIEDCNDNPFPPVVVESGNLNVTFSLYKDPSFKDWDTEDEDGPGADFDSYLHTYYHIQDDTILWMQSPYIYTYTTNVSRNGQDPSLFLQPVWEWSESASSHKFARLIQVYDYKQDQLVSNTKNRVRGSGRALQLRFNSEEGKDFNLLSWGIFFDKNQRY